MADICISKPEVVISQLPFEIARQNWFANRLWPSGGSDINRYETGSSIPPSRSPSWERIWRHIPPNRGNITPVWLFWLYCFFFSIQPPGRTVALIVTLNGSMTCFRPRTVLLGVRTIDDVIWGKYSPKTPQKGVWIGSFKLKRQNLYIAISPELLIRRTSD